YTTFLLKKHNGLQTKIKNNKGKVLEIENTAGLSFLYDLALTKIQKEYKGPVLKLADKMESDKKAYMMGFPSGKLNKMILAEVDEVDFAFFAGLIDDNHLHNKLNGASGSPIFNHKAKVIGVQNLSNNIAVIFIKSQLLKTVLRVKRGTYENLENLFINEITKAVRIAESGDSHAQFVFAYYLQNESKEIYQQEILNLYKKSAVQGHIWSQINLGAILHAQNIDIEEGKKWMLTAMKQKNKASYLVAQFVLAMMLASEKKFPESLILLRQLDKRGIKLSREFSRKIIPPQYFQQTITASEIEDTLKTVKKKNVKQETTIKRQGSNFKGENTCHLVFKAD
ncbi:MAG: trypsin-like peptidase domain-containing protein, partial [Oligoflexia bacterium]|nr:trypsin-like peptidase domain-containing protein [Oligoflexia bacterium]